MQVARAGEDRGARTDGVGGGGSAPRGTPSDRLAGLRRGSNSVGGGLEGGRGGIQGEPVALDTRDPDYQAYFNRIRPKIYEHWSYPEEAARKNQYGSLVLVMGLAHSGALQYLKVEQPSKYHALDEAIEVAVKLAQPFPELPPEIRAKHPSGLVISVAVIYTLERRPEVWLKMPRP
jgi:TonB family protein